MNSSSDTMDRPINSNTFGRISHLNRNNSSSWIKRISQEQHSNKVSSNNFKEDMD